MFKNYLITAYRNIKHQKLYSFINIFGLAIGMACCILVFLLVRHELSYDTFHERADTIYYVQGNLFENINLYRYTSGLLGPSLQADFPEVVSFVRINGLWHEDLVKYGEKICKEIVVIADPTFFTFFTFPLEYGNPETVLRNPKSIVLSKQMAEKYFGKDNPIGKTLLLKHPKTTKRNEFEEYTVTGIAEPIPGNSSIQFDFLISFDKTLPYDLNSWEKPTVRTFIRLSSKSQAAELTDKFPGFIKKYFDTLIKQNPKATRTLQLYPLIDYHMGANYAGFPLTWPNNPVNLYILSGIALLILLIACFNFMNLSIAGSSTRIKEIGLRKVLGAQKNQVAKQFWFESILLSFFALIIGISLSEIFLPAFNALADKSLNFNYLVNWQTLLFLIVLTFIVGIVAGSYPAVVFSGFTAIDILRGRLKMGGKNVFTRLLIVIQFTLSIFLIVSVIIMRQQQSFLMNKDLGYDKRNVVVIPLFADWGNPPQGNDAIVYSLKNELIQHDNIISVSGSFMTFTWGFNYYTLKDKEGTSVDVPINYVDYDFIQTLGIKIIKGRNFSPEFPSDINNAIIVNESFVKRFDISDPIGRDVSDMYSELKDVSIIGVMKDYYFKSLHEPIEPAFLMFKSSKPRFLVRFLFISVKIKETNVQETIAIIKEKFRTLVPDQPFSYTFLEDELAAQYESDKRWNNIVKYASILAILIACSGLFGLTLLTVARKTKEIGIRKILGASVPGIVFMLSKEFLKWVIIANVIAWPIAYYIMHKWLQNFAYRIDLSWWMFVLAGLLALIIALLTVSFQAIKAARANPVESLRYE